MRIIYDIYSLVVGLTRGRAWKHHLATLSPPKPPLPPRRPRGLDDIMMNLLEYTAPSDRSDGHRRRASRHFAELGAPLIHAPQSRSQVHFHSHPYGDRNLDTIWGGRIDEEVDSLPSPRLEMRRTRENLLREHIGALTSLPEENETDVPLRRERDFRPSGRMHSGGPRPLPLPSILGPSGGNSAIQRSTPSFRLATEVDRQAPPPPPARSTAQTPGFVVLGRPTPLRSTILAARQARGRSNASGSRDQPLVVLTDSE